MFEVLINTAIDTFQSGKKIAVDTFVKHEGLAKTLNDFVDTQTEYTKKAFDASVKAGSEVYNTVTNKTFYTDAIKAAQETAQSFVASPKKGK